MAELKTISRVTVYADGGDRSGPARAVPGDGLDRLHRDGLPGQGEHDTVDDPFVTVTRVRIELLVQTELAHEILTYVDSPALKSHPVSACMETVQVVASERY